MIKISKSVMILLFSIVLSGCATKGVVNMPVIEPIQNKNLENKKVYVKVYYSQPEPGIFSGGKQQKFAPIKDAKLSIASSRVLSRFDEIVKQQLPLNSSITQSPLSDYKLLVYLKAKDKKGPAYQEYNLGTSLAKGILSLGLASDDYSIIGDFDIKYELFDNKENKVHEGMYTVYDEIEHERGGFDSYRHGDDLAQQLLEKHIRLTMHEYFLAMPKSST
ncbi:hypothetical protein CF386_08765 [Paraphotobacterium marinum]|uniref:Lipoprotein n=1 Tax=Paraphotobacterium marinum TaxID=1755811 RepID=A0A220VFS0_9GAMM|nr:hypothetical protein [Paraphotobacterium marinum]ASK79151.1 hypothetical protein CF386_08765 [Paraphotobacterium marinum]